MAEKKLKIAFINYYQNSVNRGAERFVLDLSTHLTKLGHTVYVYSEEKILINENKFKFFKKIFLDLNSIKILLFTLTKSWNLVYKEYDIVVPINGGWQPFIVRLISFFRKFKVVIIGQSGKGWDDRINLLSFPNLFIATSNYQKSWAKKTNIFVRTKYIPNGINFNVFNNDKAKLKTNLKRPIVLTVAAFVPDKRIDLVIKAVSKTDCSLLLIGDGILKDELNHLCEKLLPNRYEIKKLNFEEVTQAYNIADVFALTPQETESFGIVFLEAMSANLPVITQKDKIRPEIIGDAGIFTNPLNKKEFADSINHALKVKWRNKPSKHAQKFDWEIIAKIYEKEFIKVCQK